MSFKERRGSMGAAAVEAGAFSGEDDTDQQTPGYSREYLAPEYGYSIPTKTREGRRAFCDGGGHALAEEEIMVTDEMRHAPRGPHLISCPSESEICEPQAPSRALHDKGTEFGQASLPSKQLDAGFQRRQLTRPASTGAETQTVRSIADIAVCAPAFGPSRTWLSPSVSPVARRKASELPEQDVLHQKEKRSSSRSLENFISCQGKVTLTSRSDVKYLQSQMERVDRVKDLDKQINVLRSSSPQEKRSLSPRAGKKVFLSTMNTFDAAYHSVRRDLEQYMEHVRGKTSEDGTPSVTFPRNFDRVVGLMGHNDLRGPASEQNTCDGGGGISEGRALARDGTKDQRAPPSWTKHLLEEGLDRTKTFAKYRGILFAEGEDGKERLMRGLAKMRELDLRLARITERARDLRRIPFGEEENANEVASIPEVTQATRYTHSQGSVTVGDIASIIPSSEAPTAGPPHDAVTLQTSKHSMGTEGKCESRNDGRCSQAFEGRSANKAFMTQKFHGAGGGASWTLCTDTRVVLAPRSLDRSNAAISPSPHQDLVNKVGDEGATSGAGSRSGVSFVLKNKQHAAKVRRRLTDEQEGLVSRFLIDADGFNDEGGKIGEPTGVWAEIAPYGGAGASQNTARLAEIDAQVASMRGLVPDESTSNDKANHGTSEEKNLPLARKKDFPGEATLREQHATRQMRQREREIDAALEQVREALFKDSPRGTRRRENAVDAALEIASSAPLNIQARVRQGVGRVESLLERSGAQPVGEWELKHVLRQSEQELQGKQLASPQRIEELLTTVRRESADGALRADNSLVGTSKTDNHHQHARMECEHNDIPSEIDLETFFSQQEETNDISSVNRDAPPTHGAVDILIGRAKPLNNQGGGLWLRRKGYVRARGITPRDESRDVSGEAEIKTEGKDLQRQSSPLHAGGARENVDTRNPTNMHVEAVTVVASTWQRAQATGHQDSRRPRRNPRNKQHLVTAAGDGVAEAVTSPEIIALFRAPLLAPALYPPIAGIAAAAVASGGSNRLKNIRGELAGAGRLQPTGS